jgi:hypothetical protein
VEHGARFNCLYFSLVPSVLPTNLCTRHHNRELQRATSSFKFVYAVTDYTGRAIAQAVSRWLLTVEAWVSRPCHPYGICGGQSGIGTDFSPSLSVFRGLYHSNAGPYSRMDKGPVRVPVPQTHSLIPSQQ